MYEAWALAISAWAISCWLMGGYVKEYNEQKEPRE